MRLFVRFTVNGFYFIIQFEGTHTIQYYIDFQCELIFNVEKPSEKLKN